MLKGIGASQGYGIGNAVVISDAKLDYNHVEFTTAQNEKERLQKAVDTFIKETRKLADDVKNSAGDKEAEILEGHIVMLSDPFMLSQMQDNIDAGSVAEKAVDTVCSMFIDMFSGVDDELTQQRASDVKDIKTEPFFTLEISTLFTPSKILKRLSLISLTSLALC